VKAISPGRSAPQMEHSSRPKGRSPLSSHHLLSLLKFFTHQTDKIEMEIFKQKVLLRQIAMVFLFRHGGLMVIETAQIMNLAYSTVNKERKR